MFGTAIDAYLAPVTSSPNDRPIAGGAATAAAAPPVRSFVVPPELVPERAGVVAFVGSHSRQGDWLLPRQFRVVAAMGSAEIDLTRARVGPGTSVIEVRAVLGSVEITAPPDVRVECEGSGVFGNFSVNNKAQASVPPDAPVIRVTGTAFLGNVEITVLDPNAPGWLDRLTARLAGRKR